MKGKHFSAAVWIGCVGLGWMLSARAAAAGQAGKSPVKVFLLVGQSNMQGKGSVAHLRKLATDPQTKATYGHLVDKDGQWVARDDVWIWYMGKKGKLTIGYGSPGGRRVTPPSRAVLGVHRVGDLMHGQARSIPDGGTRFQPIRPAGSARIGARGLWAPCRWDMIRSARWVQAAGGRI